VLDSLVSGFMLDALFFLISRLNNACSLLIFNLQINNRSGSRISQSEVFSSGRTIKRFPENRDPHV